MKNLLFLSVFLLFIIEANAQVLEWAKHMGGTGDILSNSIAVDSNGNVYTTGYFNGTVDFDPGQDTFNLTSIEWYDIFVCKLDVNGNFIWAKRMGKVPNTGYYNSIAVDTSENVYITGYFTDTADFDPGVGTYNLISAGFADVYILKLDPLGDFLWARRIGGIGNEFGNSIVVDVYGNVLTIGKYDYSVDFDPGVGIFNVTSVSNTDDIFILKLNSSGNFIWARSMGGTHTDEGNSITIDASGNIYATGSFCGLADFDPGAGTFNLTSVSNFEDIFISKLDSSGNFLWAKGMGGTSDDIGYSIAVDTLGNVYTTGRFRETSDFDPGTGIFNLTSAGDYDNIISKLDAYGNFVWAKCIGGVDIDLVYSISLDNYGNVYTSGRFFWSADFDPGIGTFNLGSGGGYSFLSKLDSSGSFLWAICSGADMGCVSIDVDNHGNVYETGNFNHTVDFDPGTGIYNLTPFGWDFYVLKLKQKGLSGIIYNDINQNCSRGIYEIGLQSRHITINPGNIIAQTNEAGVWTIDSLSVGTYIATADISGNWTTTCPVSQTYTVTNPNDITYVPDFGLVSTQPCASPEISINMPFMRPCFSNQLICVTACNQYIATGVLDSAYVDVELDSLIIPDSASTVFTSLGNNTYRFHIGSLNPGQCVNFTINCTVSCSADLGQTLCMQANIYPADSCIFDTVPDPFPVGVTPCDLPWDHSSLQVEGYCENDSIYFVIHNTGNPTGGDMECWSPVRVYVDGVYTILDSVLIAGGDSVTYAFAGDGHTWRLEADQHPLHPGNSHPNATVELCGDSANWTPGNVTILPQDDSDPVVDIYCGVVTGSYDPNDKTGYPTGVSGEHYVSPNQQLQYVIRFQNTGTDTAFTVIVRDTLDTDLDIFSVESGAASHNYHFYMHGPRVLEWTFYNIMLPDSNVNEPASNGFVTFTVNQNPDLPFGTLIKNSADIYFDFNAPVITNQTVHTVSDHLLTNYPVQIRENPGLKLLNIYPNPSSGEVCIEVVEQILDNDATMCIYDLNGYRVFSKPIISAKTYVNLNDLSKGVYIVKVISKTGVEVGKIVVR